METAITARLYFVLFSGAANSNNKLSPILPLQPELPPLPPPFALSARESPATAPSPPPLFVPHRRLAPSALPSSFERFVSRTFPERPRFLSSSRLLRYIPTLFLPAARFPRLCDTLEAMKFLCSPADTTWNKTSWRTRLFDKHERFQS